MIQTKQVTKANNNPDKVTQKGMVYEEFILWFALPPNVKLASGVESQADFAEQYNVAAQTLTRWKDRADFQPRVRELRKKWAFDKTGEVIYSIYKSALKGNDKSQKLWMQVFEDFTEKQDVQHTLKVEVSVNDIRYLIEALPVKERQIHYDNLRDLLLAADKAKRTGEFEDSSREHGSTSEISDETYITARDVSDERGNAIPVRHTERVCENMERQVSENNHQSSAWRGKE